MDQSPTTPTSSTAPSHPTPPTSGMVPPIKLTPKTARPRRSIGLGRLFVGLLVVLIGISLLSNSMGWSWAFTIDIWKFWPVLVILAGVSMLFKQNSGWIVALLVLLVIGIGAASTDSAPWNSKREVITSDLNINKEPTAKTADIRINTGAAQLNISGGSTQLLSGQQISNFGRLNISSQLNDTEQVITLSEAPGDNHSRGWLWFGSTKNTVDLKMNSDLASKLTIDGGAMDMNLDLTTVPISDLTIKSGASSVTLGLGDKPEHARVSIRSGASTLRLTLPKTVGVRLSIDAGASSKTLTDFTSVGDNRYESTNYATTQKKMDLDIEAGASTIDLGWR